MIKQFKYASSTPVFKRLFLLLTVSTLMYAAQAQQGPISSTIDTGFSGATVKLIGVEKNMYILNVYISNAGKENFCISVSEHDDNVLYEEVYNDKVFNKLFKVPANEGALNMVVTNLKDFSKQSFSIDANLQPLKDAVVKGKD